MIGHLDEELSVYLDGELLPPEARKVTAHLAGCDFCRDSLGELIEIRAQLRSLPMMDYVWEPARPALVIPLRRRPGVIAGATAAAAAAIVAVVSLSAPREVIDFNQGDVSAFFGARQTLDQNFTGRVIPPDILTDADGGDTG